jgi:hypothetical protein
MGTVRIKRRLSGAAGPPAALFNAELAFNEVSGVLYYGQGLTLNSQATDFVPIGGFGAFVGLTGNQQIAGEKTFTSNTFFDANVRAPTPALNDSSTLVATTEFVKNQNYATLVDGLVPASQLPSYVDDIVEYGNITYLPETGEPGKIYVTTDTNRAYRWSGSTYIEIVAAPGSTDEITEGSANLFFTVDRVIAAAPVKSIAGRIGDVFLTKLDVGLAEVDNTADLNKPVAIAVQFELDAKAPIGHLHDVTDVVNLPGALTTITQTLDQKVNTDDIIDGGTF